MSSSSTFFFLPCLIILYRGAHFDAVAASAFSNLRKFTFCLDKDNEEEADLEDIRAVLNRNESTLKHLVLGRCSDFDNSLDLAFESVTISNLTHLDLFSTYVSGFVLDRIAHARNLQSLTLHGSFPEPEFASQMFATGSRTFLPHLESFGFVMEDADEDLYESVLLFLQKRNKLRRLDLGSCPGDVVEDVVEDVLPHLQNLRVLAVRIDEPLEEQIESLIEALPTQMVAIRLSVDLSNKPLVHTSPYLMRLSDSYAL